jgi:hypothetical protein
MKKYQIKSEDKDGNIVINYIEIQNSKYTPVSYKT